MLNTCYNDQHLVHLDCIQSLNLLFTWLNLYLFIIPVVFHYPHITKLNGRLKNASLEYKNVDENSTKPHHTD